MSVIETELVETVTTEEELVTNWRLEQLVHAGYERPDALLLAVRSDVDLHFATDLLRRGCPAPTALDILR